MLSCAGVNAELAGIQKLECSCYSRTIEHLIGAPRQPPATGSEHLHQRPKQAYETEANHTQKGPFVAKPGGAANWVAEAKCFASGTQDTAWPPSSPPTVLPFDLSQCSCTCDSAQVCATVVGVCLALSVCPSVCLSFFLPVICIVETIELRHSGAGCANLASHAASTLKPLPKDRSRVGCASGCCHILNFLLRLQRPSLQPNPNPATRIRWYPCTEHLSP